MSMVRPVFPRESSTHNELQWLVWLSSLTLLVGQQEAHLQPVKPAPVIFKKALISQPNSVKQLN